MRIPSSNILKKALRLIKPTIILYYKYFGRTLNDIGTQVSTYLDAVELAGSWQPVPREDNYKYGLTLQQRCFRFFCSKNVLDLGRDRSNDEIAYNGFLYQCQSITDWYGVDGWVEVFLIEIGIDTKNRLIFGFNQLDSDNENQNFEQGNLAPRI